MNTTRIIEKVNKYDFKEIIDKYQQKINVDPHALDHLSEAQRKVVNQQKLKDALLKEKPVGIGLQKNGHHAIFYRRKGGYLKIIIKITDLKLEIITFIYSENIPNLDRLKNGN